MTDFRYSGTDGICALFIALLVLLLGAATLTCGLPYWGDDSAAYISEGIAIADGTFRKQAELNYIMHPADLSDEADPEGQQEPTVQHRELYSIFCNNLLGKII